MTRCPWPLNGRILSHTRLHDCTAILLAINNVSKLSWQQRWVGAVLTQNA
jgi:hypothetical protein